MHNRTTHPKTWKEANIAIFFKKGNRKDINNYIAICLLSNMYKLFTKIITTRLEKKLDQNQPRENAGFRSKYSTTDHIHSINQLKEKCREYNIPLCVAFVDYEKVFDSVQTQAILTSLQEQGKEDDIVYIEILKDILYNTYFSRGGNFRYIREFCAKFSSREINIHCAWNFAKFSSREIFLHVKFKY